MATYTLTDGTRKTQLTISGDTTVIFPTKLDYFGIRVLDGDGILASKLKAPTVLEDGIYSTDEGDGDIIIDDGIFTDTLYLKGSGTVVVFGGARANYFPFKSGAKGGGGSSGGCNYKGTTTTAIENGSTTNPIVIDGEEYTAVFGDIVVYGYTEFVFDGTTWSEFGRPFDTTPTSGSANAVTSDGIYALIRSGTGVQSICTNNTGNLATGLGSTAMGIGSRATTRGAFATGEYTIAAGQASFATGFYSTTTNANQFSCGMYNNSRNGDLFNVGNGTTNSRSNIVEVNRTEMNVNGDIKCNGVSLPTPYTTMPTITASMLGKVVQYVGASDSNYKQGWNYVAVSDGAAEPTYSWQALMDSVPTSGSNNPVTSGGIYSVTPWIRQPTGLGAYMGASASASGVTSVAVGYHSTSRGKSSLALGYYAETGSSAHYSASIGNYTQTTNTNMLAIGKYNLSREGDLFNIGTGLDGSHRSNILEVNSTSMNVNGDIQKNGVSLPTPYTTMPTVTSDMLGQIAQYVGTTDSTYTQGYFYIAASDGAAEPTYSWANLPVSPRTYSETVLWENEGTTAPNTITLSAAYTNYDAICVLCFTSSNLYSSVIFLTSLLSLNAAYRFYWNYNEYIEYILSTATMFTLNNVKAGMYPQKIVGIKY